MDKSKVLDLLYELRKECTRSDEEYFSSLGITQAEYNMFLCLRDCQHFNSYSVAERMQLSLSRISRIIDKMVNKKLLSRTTNKADRRAIDITLSKKGQEIMSDIIEYRQKHEDKMIQNLNEQELADIKASLSKLISII